MNRFRRNAGKASSTPPSQATLTAAEQRFQMIRRIKARVRAERALGFSEAQILNITKAIQARELAQRLEEVRMAARELEAIALRATSEALAENSPVPAPVPFNRWLSDTINNNRSHIPMKVVPDPAAPKA